jgi:uncharacterized damage-inducible protein DinB
MGYGDYHRLDQCRIGDDICDFWSLERLSGFGINHIYKSKNSWLSKLLSCSANKSHPAKQLAVIGFLFDDFQQFVTAVSKAAAAEQFPESASTSKLPGPVWLSELPDLFISHKGNATSLAKVLGVSPPTIRQWADNLKLSDANSRSPEFRERNCKVLAALCSGTPIKEIALIFGISERAVYTHLQCDAETIRTRDQALEKASIEDALTRRSEFTIILAQNSKKSRTQLRNKFPALYAWFFKNDKDWFFSVLPDRKFTPKGKNAGNARVDWPNLDAKWARRLKNSASQLAKIPGRPRRITRRRFLVSAGLQFDRVVGNLYRLPRTAAVIARVTETVEQSQRKRFEWAVAELQRQGRAVTHSNAMLLGAIPVKQRGMVQSWPLITK